ncbi:MAG: hypothetical protein MJY62_05185, partial [Bacteroidales bacterium]|nr:hypothetical protein [Bacteroidales bacterium]
MKRIFKYASAALAIALAASCAKETLTGNNQVTTGENLVSMTITATLDDSKATVGESSLLWSDGDKIAIFDGADKREFTLAAGAGTSTAYFTGEVDAQATEFYAVSPLSAATSYAEGTFTVNLPSEQRVSAAQTADPKALIQVGKVEDGGLALKNVFSRAAVKISSDGIKSVKFLSVGTEKIAGVATCGVDAVSTAASTAVSEITLSSSEEDGFAQGTYYIALLPATLENGFKVSLSAADKVYLCGSASSNEFARNGGRILGDVIANPATVQLPVGISTGAELKTFVDNANYYGSGITVYLKNDIDLSEVSSSWSNPKPFWCTFDGNNYAIKNIDITGTGHWGILGDAHGDVKNLVFGENGGSDKITVAGAGETTKANVAPITARMGTASISNVINYAAVNVTSDAINATNIAGIVGNMASSGVLEECRNFGTIDAKNNVAEWLDLGGITGSMSGTGKISICTNYGALSYTGST